jgi:hypothetical protein
LSALRQQEGLQTLSRANWHRGIQRPFMVRPVALATVALPAHLQVAAEPAVREPPVTCRKYLTIASAALLVGVALSALWPSSAATARGSCSTSCRTSYGNCYKKSQDRAKCQAQLQRCLETCIDKKR